MAGSDGRDDFERPRGEHRRWWPVRGTGRDTDRVPRPRRSESVENDRENDQKEQSDSVGRAMEALARGMGTPAFLIILTVFVAIWMAWNSMAPTQWRFDSADIGFTALTLMLSLQASYAAPMILLAQNRQDDRDRVSIQQDRQRAERNTADLEYLAREIVALRMLVGDMATKDFIRAELRSLLEDLDEDDEDEESRGGARRAPDPEAEDYLERDDTEQRRRAKARREAAAERDRSADA